MPLTLPAFDDPALITLSVCGMHDADQADKLAWLGEEGSLRVTTTNKSVDVLLAIERHPDKTGHVHIDVGRPASFKWLKSDLEYSEVPASKFRDHIEKLIGLTLEVRATAEFRIPLDALPKRGLVTTLLELNTEANGMELRMKGCEMVVNDDLYSGFSFRLSNDAHCDVSILMKSTVGITNTYLVDFEKLAIQGIEWFAFESTRKTPHAVRPMPRPRKRSSGA